MGRWYYVQALLAHQPRRKTSQVGVFYIYAEGLRELFHKYKTEVRGIKNSKTPLKLRALQEPEASALERKIESGGLSVKYARKTYYCSRD